MPDGFERLRNLQLRSRIVKEPEKVSSPTQSSTYQALISPSAKLDSGVKDLANNPLQGMLKIGLGIAEAGFLPVSLPFAIADDVVGGKEEGEHNVFSRINQGLQGVMHLPANLVEGGTHLINEGMKALGVDTKKVDDAIMFELQRRGLMSWTANPEELAETINEVNQMAATLLAFKGAHNLGKTIRGEKVTKQDLAKLRTDRTDIGLPKSEPKQLGAPKGDFAKIEVDPMGRTRTVPKGENTQAYTKLELFRDELAGKKESLIKERDALKQRAFDKNLTKEQRSDASKRLKEIKPELDEISKRLPLIEKELQSKRGEVEFKDLPETKLLPEKRIEPIPTENVPSNINFSVATEPGAKTITKMGTEKVLPVKRVTEKTDVKPDVKPVDKVQEPTGKIELRTDKNGKDYYYNTETKKRTSKEEFEKQRPKEIDQYTPEDIALGQAPTPLVIREAQQIKGKNFEKDFETFKNKPENKKRLDESPDKIRTESALIEEYAQGIVAESKGGKPFDIKSRVEDAVKKSEPEKLTIGKSEVKPETRLIEDAFNKTREIQDATGSQKLTKLSEAKKLATELRTRGINAEIKQSGKNWDLYIDKVKQDKRSLGLVEKPERVKIEDVELSPKVERPFKNEAEHQQVLRVAEAFVEPKDLPSGIGKKVLEKGIDDIRKNVGAELSSEAKIVREVVENISKDGKQIQPVSGARKSKQYISPEEIKQFAKEKPAEFPKEKFTDIFGDEVKTKTVHKQPEQLRMEGLGQAKMPDKPITGEGKSEGTTPLFQQSKEVKGQGNIFKSETLERLRQEAKNELNNTNIGANPQLFMKSVQIGAIHFKNGITKFADWSKQMIKDLGEKVKPRLLSIWNEIKKFGEDLGKIAVDKIGEFVESKYNPARPLKMIDQSLFERPKSKQEIKTQREFSDVYKDIKKTSPEELAKNREVFKKRHSVIERGREALRKDMESFKSFVREKGVPLDTRLFQISPKIYQYVKQGEFELKNRIIKADDVVVKFTEPLSKLPIEVRADLDILLKNRELDAAYKIFDRYGLRKEFDNVRKLMDDLGTELGVGKIRDYFPRMVKDYEGLLKEFKGSEFWNTFERLIREKEKKIGRELTIEEQATLINNAIRGYNPGIRLSNIGAMRERIIPKLDAELSRYYHDFDAAVTAYVGQSIEHTAALKFFGKQKVDIPAITNESIGKLIAEKMLDTDKILNPKQVQEVTNILKAAYQGKGTTGWASTVKNVTYLTRLFNWFGAMIQLGDLAMPIYRSPLETPKAFAKALGERVGLKPKEKIKLKDIGVDLDRIAQEIVDPSKRSKVMNWATKYSLFKAIDAIGKDTYINALYNKYHRLAKNGKLKEGHPDYWRFKETFGEKANEVIAEFGRKEFTPRTAFQLFNELDKTQPYTKWSLPEGYHTSGQAQLFYQFKTFMIRRLDFVLNESVRQFTNKELPKKQRIEAAGRLARVLMSVSLAEGGIDSAREFLKTGQMPQLDEVVADNLLRLVLLSKYDVTRLKRDGLGSMIANKVFPSLGVFSDAGSDLVSLFGTDPKFRTLRNVPVMGEALYSWMRSATKKSTRRNTR